MVLQKECFEKNQQRTKIQDLQMHNELGKVYAQLMQLHKT